MEARVPFQVMLDPEQHHQLRRVAEARHVSIGSLVRESVVRYLAGVAVEDDPLFGIIGLAQDSGPRPHGDVATEHDAYLASPAAAGAAVDAAPEAPPRSRRRTVRPTRATG